MAVSEERDMINTGFKVVDGEGRAADAASSVGRAKSAGETVIIVGAGTAGCVAALSLAARGFQVKLIERDMSEQDRIVGELMQPGGIRALERLGLDDCAKKHIDSVGVDGYVVFTSNKSSSGPQRNIVLNYPVHDPDTPTEYFGMIESCATSSHAETPKAMVADAAKMPKGRSFHNCRFVQELRMRCLKEPSITVVRGYVSKLLEEGGRAVGVQYKALDQEVAEGQEREVRTMRAPLTIVADGIWSSLRKEVDAKAKPHQVSTFVGLIMEHPPMQSPLPVRGCGHVVLGEPSPILLYQISSTETRVLVDVAGKMPSAATGELAQYLREQTAPQLPACVQPAFLAAVEKGSIKSMPNRSLPRAKIDKDGVILLGDALNMRHPLTGGGMTVAIRDAETVVGLLVDTDVRDDAAMRRLKAAFVARRREYAATINVLANALHSVFSTPGMDPTRKDLRDACFDYLSLGGCFAAGPIGLLSGLAPKPAVLATHFFMVALYGVQRYLRPFPTPRGLRRMYDVLHVACTIIMPLLEKEQSTMLSWWPVRTLVGLVFPYRQTLTAE